MAQPPPTPLQATHCSNDGALMTIWKAAGLLSICSFVTLPLQSRQRRPCRSRARALNSSVTAQRQAARPRTATGILIGLRNQRHANGPNTAPSVQSRLAASFGGFSTAVVTLSTARGRARPRWGLSQGNWGLFPTLLATSVASGTSQQCLRHALFAGALASKARNLAIRRRTEQKPPLLVPPHMVRPAATALGVSAETRGVSAVAVGFVLRSARLKRISVGLFPLRPAAGSVASCSGRSIGDSSAADRPNAATTNAMPIVTVAVATRLVRDSCRCGSPGSGCAAFGDTQSRPAPPPRLSTPGAKHRHPSPRSHRVRPRRRANQTRSERGTHNLYMGWHSSPQSFGPARRGSFVTGCRLGGSGARFRPARLPGCKQRGGVAEHVARCRSTVQSAESQYETVV